MFFDFVMAKWLLVSDVVQLMQVPEATIYRWIRQGDIPCIVRSGKYYFKKARLVSATGVDRISISSLIHSASAIDLKFETKLK